MWRKPDREPDRLGPTWRDISVLWNSPSRRRRAIRWAVVLIAIILLVAVVGLLFLPDSPSVGSWGFLVGIAVTAFAVCWLLARLVLGSLLPFEIGRGAYRYVAEKRRHRAWSKQAAQRNLFKR